MEHINKMILENNHPDPIHSLASTRGKLLKLKLGSSPLKKLSPEKKINLMVSSTPNP